MSRIHVRGGQWLDEAMTEELIGLGLCVRATDQTRGSSSIGQET
jgi:hypothetical protein